MEQSQLENTKLRILKKRINQYRTIKTFFVMFPSAIDIKTLEIESYTLENGQSRLKGISVFNFDTISLINISSKGFYQCIGLNGSKQNQIILKQKMF